MFSYKSIMVSIHFATVGLVFWGAVCSATTTDSNFVVVGDDANDGGGCQFLLESFAHVSANFTFCAIRNARPILLCQECTQSYVLALEVHDDILKLEDEAGELCKEKLMNLDRLEVVEGAFNYIQGLWNRASCDACFDLGPDGKPEKLNSNVKEILSLHNATQTCISTHRNDTTSIVQDPLVCTECKESYLELNAKYNHMKDVSPFCMDIIDMINNTRYEWSVQVGCCLERQRPELTFLISTGIITLLPAIFYLLACSFNGKREQEVVLKKRCSISYPTSDSDRQASLPTLLLESSTPSLDAPEISRAEDEPAAGCSNNQQEVTP